MSYNTKNYTKQGGDETHFGGKVVFEDGCVVEGLPSPTLPVASASTLGGVKIGEGLSITEQGVLSVNATPDAGPETKGLVKQGVAVAEAAGANPTAAEFKALLDSLKAAGILATPTSNNQETSEPENDNSGSGNGSMPSEPVK